MCGQRLGGGLRTEWIMNALADVNGVLLTETFSEGQLAVAARTTMRQASVLAVFSRQPPPPARGPKAISTLSPSSTLPILPPRRQGPAEHADQLKVT